MSLLVKKNTNPQERYSVFDLQREIDSVFGNLFKGFDLAPFRASSLDKLEIVPKIDISETDKTYHVSAELPGVDEKDVEVILKNGLLTIKGEKRFESEKKEKNFHRVERSYGSFERSITLPQDADQEKISADFKKGVLNIDISKKASAIEKEKKIEIKSE